jgi:hypothetical protein
MSVSVISPVFAIILSLKKVVQRSAHQPSLKSAACCGGTNRSLSNLEARVRKKPSDTFEAKNEAESTMTTRLQLSLSAKGLKNLSGILAKSDPFGVVTVRGDNKDNRPEVVGRTDV